MPDYTEFVNDEEIIKGTYPHPNSTDEEDALEFLDNVNDMEISFGMANITEDTTIRVHEKVDDSTYEQATKKIWPTNFPDGNGIATIEIVGKNVDVKVTFQSAVLEGSIKNVPHARKEKLGSNLR